ncbi:EthD domain-containing protein [Aspergillus karnatakaensis]|uniref:EthD domain-containing protein n=1 Tax=Aspergillus karnatakaensis TaxID=1810916 RepID=UPI003CCE5175
MPTRRLYSFTIFAYRKPGMSEEDYHAYVTEKHIPLVQSHYPKFGIVSYIVTHFTTKTRQQLHRILGPDIPESVTVDYDSTSQFLFRDIEDYVRGRQDPFYKEVIEPDQANFADASRTKFVTGWVEVAIVGGEPNGYGGIV